MRHLFASPLSLLVSTLLLCSPISSAWAEAKGVKDCELCPELRAIPAGSFEMGSAQGYADEKPVRRVEVSGFLMGKTEVTQGQWKALMGSNPSHFKQCGDDCPVDSVSWLDAQAYLQKLSAVTGKAYRLPSEAEWEYAARAGSSSDWSFGHDESQLNEHAWSAMNAKRKTQRVAGKSCNQFGLYDMHGNVWEWVQDTWHDSYLGAPTDGSVWQDGGQANWRVLRGGAWNNGPARMRASDRNGIDLHDRANDTGFRVARDLTLP